MRMAGVRVGRVEERELEDGLAHVTFTVSGDQTVYADSRAEINFLNLIGQRYLDITRGSGESRLLARRDHPGVPHQPRSRPDRTVQRVQAALRPAAARPT